jgi:hypothetical protein
MKKTVLCETCKIPFQLQRPLGRIKDAYYIIKCPYPGCQAPNKVRWPAEGEPKPIAFNLFLPGSSLNPVLGL